MDFVGVSVTMEQLSPAKLITLCCDIVESFNTGNVSLRITPAVHAEQFCKEKNLDVHAASFVTEIFFATFRYQKLTTLLLDGLYGAFPIVFAQYTRTACILVFCLLLCCAL